MNGPAKTIQLAPAHRRLGYFFGWRVCVALSRVCHFASRFILWGSPKSSAECSLIDGEVNSPGSHHSKGCANPRTGRGASLNLGNERAAKSSIGGYVPPIFFLEYEKWRN